MEEALNHISQIVALGCGMLAVVCVAVGALKTVWASVRSFGRDGSHGAYRQVWLGFATWLILALEFALAADIAATVFAPDWTEIGQLAAIAAIRTVLNLFLERDLEAGQRGKEVSLPETAQGPRG